MQVKDNDTAQQSSKQKLSSQRSQVTHEQIQIKHGSTMSLRAIFRATRLVVTSIKAKRKIIYPENTT